MFHKPTARPHDAFTLEERVEKEYSTYATLLSIEERKDCKRVESVIEYLITRYEEERDGKEEDRGKRFH